MAGRSVQTDMKCSQTTPINVPVCLEERRCLPAWMYEPLSESECSETDENATVIPRKRLFQPLVNHTLPTSHVKTKLPADLAEIVYVKREPEESSDSEEVKRVVGAGPKRHPEVKGAHKRCAHCSKVFTPTRNFVHRNKYHSILTSRVAVAQVMKMTLTVIYLVLIL